MRRDSSAPCFAGDGTTEKIHFREQLVTHVVKHGWGMVGHRADLVHGPGIFVELDSRCCRHALPFIDQLVKKMSQTRRLAFIRKMWRMWQAGQSGNAIDRSIEDQLRPLGGPRIRKCFGFQAAGNNQVGRFFHDRKRRVPWLKGAHPRRRIQFVLDMRITVPRAAHEGCAAYNLPPRVFGDDFFAAQTVLGRKDRAFLEEMRDRTHSLRGLQCLAGNDSQIKLRQFRRIVRGAKLHVKIVRSGDPEPLFIERPRMLRPSHVCPHFRHARKVRRIKAPNRSATDNTNTLH